VKLPKLRRHLHRLSHLLTILKDLNSRRASTLVFDYTYDGPGIAKGGTGVLKVDGKVADTQKQANSIAFVQVTDESFGVGVDTRTSVNEKDYQVPFPFNGTINNLTVKLGPLQLSDKDKGTASRSIAKLKIRRAGKTDGGPAREVSSCREPPPRPLERVWILRSILE
jgi:hypothetical protein